MTLSELLKKKISTKNISISQLEKAAQLKTNAVRNIISGASKNPSAQTLLSIANALGCSIEELLDDREKPIKETNVLIDAFLMEKIVNHILNILKNQKKCIPFNVFNDILEKSYLYSIRKNKSMDTVFIEWLIDQN